jgi:hypothetical protein
MRIEFTLDCGGLERAEEFWTSALGLVVTGRIERWYVAGESSAQID